MDEVNNCGDDKRKVTKVAKTSVAGMQDMVRQQVLYTDDGYWDSSTRT